MALAVSDVPGLVGAVEEVSEALVARERRRNRANRANRVTMRLWVGSKSVRGLVGARFFRSQEWLNQTIRTVCTVFVLWGR